MKQLLTELFHIKNAEFHKKDGTTTHIAYIDPKESEDTFPHKEIYKKWGAKWSRINGIGNVWMWWLNDNPRTIYRNYIKPCLKELMTVEQNPNNEKRDLLQIINKLLADLNAEPLEDEDGDAVSSDELKEKLLKFKEELMGIVSDKDFKEKMLPIIKYRKAQGYNYSFTNILLFYLQNPKMSIVKSERNWKEVNRKIKNGALAMIGYVPGAYKKLTPQQKAEITQKFLKRKGVKDKSELHPAELEDLTVALRPFDPSVPPKLKATFYDLSQTEQIEGTEDLVGHPNTDLPWYDDKGEVTEETINLCNAIIEVIKKAGIKVYPVKDLGGARGVSKSGVIEYLADAPENSGLFNTLAHEFSHELLHQTYLKNANNNPNGYGSYFIGREQGRAVVEQQAELSAWIICRNFGYDMPTNINYVGIWGMDEKSAPLVFDTVARVATVIIQNIEKQLKMMVKESRQVYFVHKLTGLDVAKLCGCEKIYLENIQHKEELKSERKKLVESYNRWMDTFNNIHQDTKFRL